MHFSLFILYRKNESFADVFLLRILQTYEYIQWLITNLKEEFIELF